jgi:GxxExxY protein
MDANLPHPALTRRVIGAFYSTYNELGHGYLESVYENALALQLESEGVQWQRQVPIDVHFHGKIVGIFRADFIVERQLILEVKAVESLMPIHDGAGAELSEGHGASPRLASKLRPEGADSPESALGHGNPGPNLWNL